MWNEIERDHPIPWAQTMAATARTWAAHRAQSAAAASRRSPLAPSARRSAWGSRPTLRMGSEPQLLDL